MSIDNVQDITPRIQYVAAAAQTDFDYPFPIFEDSDLVVDVDGDSGLGFTVTGAGNDGGGNIVLAVPLSGGEIVTIYRDIPIERTSDFQTNGPLTSATFNDELDRLTLISQQFESRIGRCLRLPIISSALDTQLELLVSTYASKLLGFDANGVPTPVSLLDPTVPLTSELIGTTLDSLVQSPAEIAANITPANYAFLPGNVWRYWTGIPDWTSAFNAAATVSKTVTIPPGTYALTAGQLVFATGVRFVGAGRGAVTLTFTANGDLFSWTAGVGGGLTGVTINGSSASAGNAISVVASHRTWFDDISFNNCFNGMLVQDQNNCDIGRIWMNGGVGAYGLKYYGSSPGSANVLNFGKVIVGFGTNIVTSPIGMLIDGSAATVNGDTLGVTKGSAGLVIRNSGNFTAGPAFVTILNVQSDFAYSYGVSIHGGSGSVATTTHKLGSIYAQGCVAGPGITVSTKARNIVLEPLQITGNFQQGIYTDGRYVKIVAPQVANNSKAGSTSYPGIQIGPNSLGTTILGGLAGAFVGYAAELQSYGVLIEVGAQQYSILGTNLANNVTGQYLDNAQDASSIILPAGASAAYPNQINGPIKSLAAAASLTLLGAGNNSVLLGNATNGTGFAVQAADAATVNFLKAFGHATGANPSLAATGSDTDIGLTLLPKGAGVIQFGTAACFAANGTVATVLGSLGPVGSHTTVQEWFAFKNSAGTMRYVACY